jgi:hypothetical protein
VRDKPIHCPEPTCGRIIAVGEIEAMLEELGLVKLDDGPETPPEGK